MHHERRYVVHREQCIFHYVAVLPIKSKDVACGLCNVRYGMEVDKAAAHLRCTENMMSASTQNCGAPAREGTTIVSAISYVRAADDIFFARQIGRRD